MNAVKRQYHRQNRVSAPIKRKSERDKNIENMTPSQAEHSPQVIQMRQAVFKINRHLLQLRAKVTYFEDGKPLKGGAIPRCTRIYETKKK